MDLDHHQPAPIQVIQDAQGVILGRIERQPFTGRSIARDARGLVLSIYNPREHITRDARGVFIAHGNVLAAFLVRPGA